MPINTVILSSGWSFSLSVTDTCSCCASLMYIQKSVLALNWNPHHLTSAVSVNAPGWTSLLWPSEDYFHGSPSKSRHAWVLHYRAVRGTRRTQRIPEKTGKHDFTSQWQKEKQDTSLRTSDVIQSSSSVPSSLVNICNLLISSKSNTSLILYFKWKPTACSSAHPRQ